MVVGVGGREQCPCRIHPTDAGYAAMGKAWFRVLRDKLVWGQGVRAAPDTGLDAEQERRDREEDRSLALDRASRSRAGQPSRGPSRMLLSMHTRTGIMLPESNEA